jgi:hypothetical protein
VSAPVETCEGCRFDGAQYDLSDALGTLRAVPPMWEQLTAGLADDALHARPAPEVWSAAEYLAHSVAGTKLLGVLLHRSRTASSSSAPSKVVAPTPVVDQAPDTSAGVAGLLASLSEELGRLLDVAKAIGDAKAPGWDRPLTFAGLECDALWVLRHTVHETTHHLSDAGRVLHQLGAGAPTQQGTVARLSAGDGGVPKRAVDVAEVGDRGLVGDRQADRRNHGRPLQALCVWSLEVIQALQAEGHPIGPGDAGENITVSGIDWTTMRTGVQFLVGDVLAEVSAFATPCSKNAAWFSDRYFNRMDHDRHPGWSRVYAWVREPGTIHAGDAVVVEP